MSLRIKEEYESYKEYGNIIVNYYEILSFYPDYYKTTKYYQKLKKENYSEEKIESELKSNAEKRYKGLQTVYDAALIQAINLCDLIDYIGHYPKTYPVPKEEEKNPKMEELLEEYDIIVRYSISDDIDTMYIMSNDVVRIIETLKELLGTIEILENTAKNNEWLFQLDTDFDNTVKSLLEAIYDFPLSIYQEEGRSNREEAKYYLRLNYGNDVI